MYIIELNNYYKLYDKNINNYFIIINYILYIFYTEVRKIDK